MTTLRFAQPSDAEELSNIYKRYVIDSFVSFETPPPTVDQFAERIEHIQQQFPWLVIEDNERCLGYAYASPHRSRAAYQWSTEVSVYLDDDIHRQGIGTRLYNELFRLLQIQGYVNAYAGITIPNPKSLGFHNKLGFEEVGIYKQVGYKAGRWCDVVWLSRSLQAPPTPPSSPIPLPSLLACMPHQHVQDIVDDDTFLHRFERQEISLTCWEHRAHVRVAWKYIQQEASLERAYTRMRDGIYALLDHNGISQDKYNETVTRGYLILIAKAVGERTQSWCRFYKDNPSLFDRTSPPLLAYYTKEELLSDEARQSWIQPSKRDFGDIDW